MRLTLNTFLNALKEIGPATAAVASVAQVVEAAISALHTEDQETAKSAYADLIVDNAEGHARLQEKLEKASKL